MNTKIYNLDESVNEYFEFTVKGYSYRFRHLNTEEIEELASLKGDEEKTKEFFFKFIDKVDEKSPDFSEVAKKMITPHWIRFKEMVISEMSDHGSSQN